jgi:predicted dehydrogenase
MSNENKDSGVNRRDFLTASSALAAAGVLLTSRIVAEEFVPGPGATNEKVEPVDCAVIGLGEQGRALLAALANVNGANVKMICDSYEGIHNRAKEVATKAEAVLEYKKILDDKSIQAVWVATPTHLHKEIVLEALQAGKNVYCETPLAHTIDDARAIAKAAMDAKGQIFHAGLQERTNPQHKHVLQFVRTGALGKVFQARSQWHKRTSWRRKAPNDERQKQLNWRLDKAISTGIAGELCIHQLDTCNYFLKSLPTSVIGFGDVLAWDDGRGVPDTMQCIVEYPDKVRHIVEATLGSSFDGDAPALGWEVYAYKEKCGDDMGIALVADATKLLAAGKQPGENRDIDPKRTTLFNACDSFLTSIREKKKPGCSALDGFRATVTAIKCNEAITSGNKIVFQKEWFEV